MTAPVSAIAEAIGGHLRQHREYRSMSLSQVETASGGRFDAVVIASYERGHRRVSADRLCEIADFYHVPAGLFLPVQHRTLGASAALDYAAGELMRLAGVERARVAAGELAGEGAA